MPRINAPFLCIQSGELGRGRVCIPKRRLQFRQWPGQRISLCGGAAEPALSGVEGPRQDGAETRLHTRKHQRSHRPQINLQPGLLLEPTHELGIHAGARGRQFPQPGRCFSGEVGKHPSRSPGRLPSRFAFLHHQHPQSLLVQLQSQRKPDDARPHDDRVPAIHAFILARKLHPPLNLNRN